MKKKLLFYSLLLFIIFCLFFSILGWRLLRSRSSGEVFDIPEQIFFSPTPTHPPKDFVLTVVGDVMLARSVTTKMRERDDFAYPFLKTASLLSKADFTLINLEAPLGTDCPNSNEGLVFCADYRALEGLIKAGVDLVSLANNHTLDQGEEGLLETTRLLEENSINIIGLREPYYLEARGLKLVFLAYNAIVPQNNFVSWAYPDVIESEIKRFSRDSDSLIVYFHWGKEYSPKPQKGGATSFDPRELAHLAIDSGADLVLGAHPHVVQETEMYREKLIVYSLGNFVFDQEWSQETQKGAIGNFIFDLSGLTSWEIVPVEIKNYQPEIVPQP
ncbi:CapA family protein [Patescibacteria group bacterium]